MVLTVGLSEQLSEAGKNQLRQDGAGFLRLSLRTVKNKRSSSEPRWIARMRSTPTLCPRIACRTSCSTSIGGTSEAIDIDKQLVHMQADAVVSIEGEPGSFVDVGFIIQWSGTPAFQTLDVPVVSLAVDHIR